MEHKRSNNIAEFKGLLLGLRSAAALGIKRLLVKGDSQLIVNFSNKDYVPADAHMMAYLTELHKMEKIFLGMQLVKIPRDDNHDADDLAKRASHRVF